MESADGRVATEHADGAQASVRAGGERRERSPLAIIRSIVEDLGLLVRKEIELAKQELVAALVARGIGIGALVAAALFALFAVVFLSLAAASALDLVMPAWASRLVVALGFLALAGVGALVARNRMKAVPLVPEETKRTIKEDVEWAKAQIGR